MIGKCLISQQDKQDYNGVYRKNRSTEIINHHNDCSNVALCILAATMIMHTHKAFPDAAALYVYEDIVTQNQFFILKKNSCICIVPYVQCKGYNDLNDLKMYHICACDLKPYLSHAVQHLCVISTMSPHPVNNSIHTQSQTIILIICTYLHAHGNTIHKIEKYLFLVQHCLQMYG